MLHQCTGKRCTTLFMQANTPQSTSGLNMLSNTANAVARLSTPAVTVSTPVLKTPVVEPASTSASASASASQKRERTLSWTVESNFTKGKQVKITIRPAGKKFTIVFPKLVTQTGKRGYMNFSASHPEGISYEFGTFLHKALEAFVSPCRSIKKLQNWYAQQVPMKSSKWRDSWRNAWKKKRKQRRKARKDTEAAHAVATLTTCKTKRRLHVQSPLVYSAKGKNSTLSVPLPDFKQLRNSKGRSRAVQAIRFYARENTGSRNKPCCYMLVPAGLTPGKKRSAEYSLGQEFGANKTYLQFFKEHVAYA